MDAKIEARAQVVTRLTRNIHVSKYQGAPLDSCTVHITEVTAWKSVRMHNDDILCRCYEGHREQANRQHVMDVLPMNDEEIAAFAHVLFPTGGAVPPLPSCICGANA